MTERSNGGSVTNLPLGRSRSASRSLSARQFQSLRSELLDRLQFASEHGISFSGARDLYAAGGYPRKLTNKHYLELYERGDIAERLVEAYPKATWSPGTSIFEDEDPERVTDWEIRVNDLFTRLDIWNVFKRADILSRVAEHGYSVILIGDNSRTTFDQELPASVDFESLIYLQPLHEKNARILDFDEDLYSERFGLPLYYQLNLGKGKSQSQRQPKVYWSRVIHFTEGGLDNNVYGPPALRSIYNRLMDMEKIYTAGSEAAFKRMDPGALFTLKEGANLGATETEEAQAIELLQSRIDEFYHGMRRYLLGENMEATQLNAPVHNFGANIDSIIKVIAGAKEFPQRKLVGSEEAQLASEQDRSSWQDSIAQRRLNVAEPHVRAFVERVGGGSNPEEWDIFWPDKGELNLHEKAELVERLAHANQMQSLADGTLVLTNDEIRDMIDYEALDQEPNDETIDNDVDDPDAPIVSDNRSRSRANRSLKSGRYAALLTTKRKHIERKLKSRGVVLVNPHDVRNRNLSHTNRALAHADDRDEQTAVRRIADNARSGFAAMMVDLWASTFNDDTVDVLRLSLDNLERAESFALSLVDEMETRARLLVKDRLASVMERTAKASLRVVERRGSFSARRRVGRVESTSASTGSMNERPTRVLKLMDFNIANPRAIEWARTRSSALITEIGSSTREAVKSMIAEGIKEGRAPRLIAKEIRERVGLRSDQLETLRSFAATGATEKQVERRAKQLLKQRSELIARTETLRSSNQGLREMWYQARDNDLLPTDVKREWIATADDRTRDEHADLDGEQVGLDEPFSLGFEPGEEPACRCSQGIV